MVCISLPSSELLFHAASMVQHAADGSRFSRTTSAASFASPCVFGVLVSLDLCVRQFGHLCSIRSRTKVFDKTLFNLHIYTARIALVSAQCHLQSSPVLTYR